MHVRTFDHTIPHYTSYEIWAERLYFECFLTNRTNNGNAGSAIWP
jgi:hypothetical protein